MKTSIILRSMPPSTNALYANVAGKGRVKTDAYKVFKQAAGWDINLAHIDNQRWHSPCCVTVVLRHPRNRSDIDNRLKSLLDLLVDYGVIKDDSLVRRIDVSWDDTGILKPDEHASITITAAEMSAKEAA